MKWTMVCSSQHPPGVLSISSGARINSWNRKSLRFEKKVRVISSPHPVFKHSRICCCNNLSSQETLPVTFHPDDEHNKFLPESSNIFQTLQPESTYEAPAENEVEITSSKEQDRIQIQFLKWPLWILGPSLLLATGMVPTLWLPISSIFIGPNMASLLSLVGLDCVFNLGATLFLLMADACARPLNPAEVCNSKSPFSYQFWNVTASLTGFVLPMMLLLGSQKGFFQPQLPFISFLVLLGPYLLLLLVQVLTELLTWHWQSPVWLVTPVVYEAYRVLQLMRGLKLGAEINAPAWIVHTMRGLVCWWVLILGVQLMRVAWYAGFSIRNRPKQATSVGG